MCIPFLNERHLLGKVRWIIFLILVITVDINLLHEELGDRKREQNSKNRAVCIYASTIANPSGHFALRVSPCSIVRPTYINLVRNFVILYYMELPYLGFSFVVQGCMFIVKANLFQLLSFH